MTNSSLPTAQASAQNSIGQEESDAVEKRNNIQDLHYLHYPRRRLSTVWQRPEQASGNI